MGTDTDKPEKEWQRGLASAKDQPSVLIEDKEDREWAYMCAGLEIKRSDEGAAALVEAALLPKGSEPPPWLDDTGMKLIGLLKERADRYIKAQRKVRAQAEKLKARKGLKIVPGGRA